MKKSTTDGGVCWNAFGHGGVSLGKRSGEGARLCRAYRVVVLEVRHAIPATIAAVVRHRRHPTDASVTWRQKKTHENARSSQGHRGDAMRASKGHQMAHGRRRIHRKAPSAWLPSSDAWWEWGRDHRAVSLPIPHLLLAWTAGRLPRDGWSAKTYRCCLVSFSIASSAVPPTHPAHMRLFSSCSSSNVLFPAKKAAVVCHAVAVKEK